MGVAFVRNDMMRWCNETFRYPIPRHPSRCVARADGTVMVLMRGLHTVDQPGDRTSSRTNENAENSLSNTKHLSDAKQLSLDFRAILP